MHRILYPYYSEPWWALALTYRWGKRLLISGMLLIFATVGLAVRDCHNETDTFVSVMAESFKETGHFQEDENITITVGTRKYSSVQVLTVEAIYKDSLRFYGNLTSGDKWTAENVGRNINHYGVFWWWELVSKETKWIALVGLLLALVGTFFCVKKAYKQAIDMGNSPNHKYVGWNFDRGNSYLNKYL